MSRNQRTQIEPGLLSLFRLTYVIWLLLVTSEVMSAFTRGDMVPPRAVLGIFAALFLLLYLHWTRIQHQLGWLYLPVGLLIASLVPMIVQLVNTIWLVQHGSSPEWSAEVFPQLFMLVIIISAQYGFRVALAFALGATGLELVFQWPLYTYVGLPMEPIFTGHIWQNIFFIFVAFLVVRLVNGQKAERNALAEKNIELTQYAATVERLSISQERNRIARELHDTLAHTLSAVAVQIEALNKQLDGDPGSARETVKQLRELTRSGLKESRRALQALRVSPLEDLGLALAMQQLVDAMIERSGLSITLTLPNQLSELAPEVEQSVYRIAEEALNNITRHAQARQVDVRLTYEGCTLELKVTDDGIGFDPEAITSDGHYGIIGMRERAILCNGQMRIESQIGVGTTVALKIEGRA